MIVTPPTAIFQKAIHNPQIHHSVLVAHVAILAYLNDVRNLVEKGVMADIRVCTDAAEEDGESYAAEAKSWKASLKVWLKDPNPLDYGEETFARLVRALSSDEAQVAKGLPGADTTELSPRSFA